MKNTSQAMCDKLLTPIIKLMFPKCLLCGFYTQVAHHHCHKSKSLRLRYDFKNLIPLCSSCHFKLHQNESYWASIIVKKRGIGWFNYIQKTKDFLMVGKYKVDYNKLYIKLNKKLASLEEASKF